MFQRKGEKKGAIIGSKRQLSCSSTMSYRIRIPTAPESFEGILFLLQIQTATPNATNSLFPSFML